MAATEQVVPSLDINKPYYPDLNQNEDPVNNNNKVLDTKIDSGVDTSESEGSCDEECVPSSEIDFSSTETLDDKPSFVRNSNSDVRDDFLDNEKHFSCERPEQVLRKPSLHEEKMAVLDIDSETVDPVPEDETDIDLSRLPTYYQDLWLGKQESAEFAVEFTKPSWFDSEKFKRGQKFAQDHLFCINYAESLSLFLLFSLQSALKPLIFTDKSSTPYKAFERYLSTLTRIMSWYQGDPWTEGSESQKHLITVRAMHRSLQHRMNSASKEELRRKTSLDPGPVWSSICPYAKDDFRSACPMPPNDICPFVGEGGVNVNQYDMAFTQFAFVGLVVTYPKRFGIHHATDEDLEGFLHLWRTLGYLLGIKDKYNYCNVDLEGVRQRTHEALDLAMKPSLRNVTPTWEHMSRCLVQGVSLYVPGFTFESSLRHLCDILNIHVPRLTKTLTLWQWFNLKVIVWTFDVFCQWPRLLTMYNNMLHAAIGKAQKASTERLEKWEAIKYPYMENDVSLIKAV